MQPAVSVAGGAAITIEHFSSGGLVIGNVSDLSALPLVPTGSVQQQQTAKLAPLVLPQDLTAAVAVFKAWRSQIEVTIGQAQDGVEAKIAVDLFVGWQNTLSSFAANFGAAGPALTTALAADQTALIGATQAAIKRGIAVLNLQCLQFRSLLFAHNVLYLRGYAEAFSFSLLTGIGSGLTEAAQLATLCIQPIQSFARFPDPFTPSTSAALDLTYGVKFGSDPVLDGAFFDVTLSVSGTVNNGTSTIQTDAAGRVVQAPIAAGTTPITIQVKSCVSPSQLIPTTLMFIGDVCHFSTITANPEPPLTILTAAVPAATVGTAYSQTLQANGGVGGYQWNISSGSLPAGLTLGATTGTISGTPSAQGSSPFTVRVSSGSQSQLRSLVLTVNAGGPPPPPPPTCPDVRIDTDALYAANSGISCALNLLIGGFNNRLSVNVALGSLTEVVESFAVRNEVPGGLSLPALRTITDALFSMAKLAVLDLPALTTSHSRPGSSGGIAVSDAADLTTIKFGHLQVVDGGLDIRNNPKLSDISGIACGARINGNLSIQNNPQLSTAAAQAKANCLVVTGTVSISNNGLP